MTTQSTRCASEELADLEEWLESKGMALVEKEESSLQPGEYIKVLQEPRGSETGAAPVWTVTWYPKPE